MTNQGKDNLISNYPLKIRTDGSMIFMKSFAPLWPLPLASSKRPICPTVPMWLVIRC